MLLGCSNETIDKDVIITDPLHGRWNMVSAIGGDFAPIDLTYNLGERFWDFDTLNGVITFVDNLDPDSTCAVCNSSQDYIVTENDTGSEFYEDKIIKLVDIDENGAISGQINLGAIMTLTDTELVVTTISVAPLIWTFAKADEN